jgi:hypothetical protein
MSCRNWRGVAFLIAALAGLAESSLADTIAVGDEIEVKQADFPTPTRGMTMNEVSSKFGAPVSKVAPVGNPPISRWDYPGFVVYFERDHVIHSVVANS